MSDQRIYDLLQTFKQGMSDISNRLEGIEYGLGIIPPAVIPPNIPVPKIDVVIPEPSTVDEAVKITDEPIVALQEPVYVEHSVIEKEDKPTPCKNCGRTDLPLHEDYMCPDCHSNKPEEKITPPKAVNGHLFDVSNVVQFIDQLKCVSTLCEEVELKVDSNAGYVAEFLHMDPSHVSMIHARWERGSFDRVGDYEIGRAHV